jgi:hypothetical protein
LAGSSTSPDGQTSTQTSRCHSCDDLGGKSLYH